MERVFYPAMFHTAEEGGFWVSFPDIPECLTDGDTMKEAYEMASDALGLSLSSMMEEGNELPKCSMPEQVELDADSFLVIVEFNLEEYRRKHNARAVKKTLSIPEWMNEEAVRQGINFSQVLQEALTQKLYAK